MVPLPPPSGAVDHHFLGIALGVVGIDPFLLGDPALGYQVLARTPCGVQGNGFLDFVPWVPGGTLNLQEFAPGIVGVGGFDIY